MRFLRVLLLIIILSMPAFAGSDTAPRFFMTLADIHFDPFVACGWRTCPLIQRLKEAEPAQWPAILQTNDKKLSGCGEDSNYLLLHTMLAAAKEKAAAQHVQFVLVLGDFIGHKSRKKYKQYTGDHSRAGYQQFIRKILQFLNAELAKSFPGLDVYMAVGNNDSYQNNYVSDTGGAFYRETATLWSTLINNPAARATMRNEFSNAGYYAITLPDQANMRLIVLNTVLFSYKAKGRNIEQSAQEELNWLQQELQTAKVNRQHVIIALHIPPNFDIYATPRIKLFTLVKLWKSVYIERFKTQLTQFAPEITGIFAGHLHSDWLQIWMLNKQEIPIIGTPSISPIFCNRPGFKIFSYSPATLTLNLDNVATYYPLGEMF